MTHILAKLLPIALLFLGVARAVEAQVVRYECKTDLSVGYVFDEDKRTWAPSSFRAGKRYILRPVTEEERKSDLFSNAGKTWAVFQGDSKVPEPVCDDEDPRTPRYMVCGNAYVNFVFNLNSNRFQHYYDGQFVTGRDGNEDNPGIEIGRCNAIFAR